MIVEGVRSSKTPRSPAGFAGRRGVLVCSLLATLPECFANKHTHTGLQSKQIDRVATDLSTNSVGLL